MTAEVNTSLLHHFADLPDPRVERTRCHELLDIVSIALCAVICGAETWEDVELFGKAKKDWLRTFLPLPNGIPSHDTFNRVFRRLDPQAFQDCQLSWLRAVAEALDLKHLAIDGKAARHSFDRAAAKSALHLVSVWATQANLTLGQVAVDAKENEIVAIPKLLQLLDLHGALVSIDAIGCQKDIVQEIREGGGDYLIAVKDNQPRLFEDVQRCFEEALETDFAGLSYSHHEEVSKGHGRHETRYCWVIEGPTGIRDLDLWRDLKTICLVCSVRRIGDKESVENRYYIGSWEEKAKRYGQAVRQHWGIENSLHYVLDVTFREDQSRLRKDHGPQNMAMLRRVAVSLLKNEKTSKDSIHGKRLHAGWDEDYLLKVLKGGVSPGK